MLFSPSKERFASKSPAGNVEERKEQKSVRDIFQNFGQEIRRSIRSPKKIVLPAEEQIVLNINCMNCQNLVAIDQIEEHSKTCTTISETVQTIESGSQHTQVIFKLKKLETCLTELTKNPELRPGDKNYINIFTRLCKKVLESTSLEQTEEVIKSLSSLLVTFKGNLSIRVYADRLQALVQEQKLVFQDLEIDKKKLELEKIKEEVEKYKHRSEILQKSIIKTNPVSRTSELNRKLDEITSDIGSMYSGSSEMTAMSGVEEDKQELDDPLPSSSNDLQKHFYSLCLTIKMRQNTRTRTQNISIQKLYNEAIQNGVPPDCWQEFISAQLKNPAKWVEEVKGRRRVQPRAAMMKPQYFEVIVEEEQSTHN